MVAKLFFFLAVSALVLSGGIPEWKQTRRRERLLYGMLFIPVTYLGVIFVTDAPLPSLDELFRAFFFAPAKRIVSWLQPSSS